jgi:hypothetical protein
MRTVTARLSVDVDIEDDATDEQIQNDARGVLLDILRQGAEIEIEEPEPELAPYERLLAEYGESIHGFCELADMPIDPAEKYMLVEENTHGGYWLTTGNDPAHLLEYQVEQEYAEEWEIVTLVDLTTGDEVDYEIGHTVTLNPDRKGVTT